MPWYEISNNITVENTFAYHIFIWALFCSSNQISQDYPAITQPVFILKRKFYFC